jgi:hypothetical protein
MAVPPTDNQQRDRRPDGGQPLMPREDILRSEGQLDQRRQGQPIPPKARTVIATLEDIIARDRSDYAQLIESLRMFVQQKRADLEAFEKLMGTK